MHVSPLDVAWWCNALGSLATVLVMFVAILCSNWDRLAREHAEELAGLEVRPNGLSCGDFLHDIVLRKFAKNLQTAELILN